MPKEVKSVFLVILSAVAIDGQIATKGAVVEVDEAEARNLLGRGKARLATMDDLPSDAAGQATDTAPAPVAAAVPEGEADGDGAGDDAGEDEGSEGEAEATQPQGVQVPPKAPAPVPAKKK